MVICKTAAAWPPQCSRTRAGINATGLLATFVSKHAIRSEVEAEDREWKHQQPSSCHPATSRYFATLNVYLGRSGRACRTCTCVCVSVSQCLWCRGRMGLVLKVALSMLSAAQRRRSGPRLHGTSFVVLVERRDRQWIRPKKKEKLRIQSEKRAHCA
jgi:hypothetical protein